MGHTTTEKRLSGGEGGERRISFRDEATAAVEDPAPGAVESEEVLPDPITIEFDSLLNKLRPWGFYQKRIWLMVTLLMDTIMEQNLFLMMFVGVSTPWHCADDMYLFTNSTMPTNMSRSCDVLDSCEKIVFDGDMTTYTTSFRLYCSRAAIPNYTVCCQMLGVLVGALFWAQIAELFGRRQTLFIIYGSGLVWGVAASFSISWQMFTVCLFMMGVASGGFLCVSFVIVQEIIGKDYRVVAAAANAWYVAVMLFCLICYLVKDWRTVVLVINCAGVPLLSFYFWVYESPRWLLLHHKFDKAQQVIDQIALLNGAKAKRTPDLTKLIALVRASDQVKKSKRYTYHHLFRTRRLTRHTLALSYSWFAVSVVAFGLMFHVKDLPGNRFFNGFLTSFIAGIALWLLAFFNKYFSRRKIHQASMGLGCIFCLFVTIMELADQSQNHKTLMTVFALIGNSALGPTWAIVYLYSVELFPTVVRNLSNAVGSFSARVGGVLAPLLLLLYQKWKPLPYIIFSLLAGVNVLVAYYYLPETRNRPLPDVLPQRERGRVKYFAHEASQDTMTTDDTVHEMEKHDILNEYLGSIDEEEEPAQAVDLKTRRSESMPL